MVAIRRLRLPRVEVIQPVHCLATHPLRFVRHLRWPTPVARPTGRPAGAHASAAVAAPPADRWTPPTTAPAAPVPAEATTCVRQSAKRNVVSKTGVKPAE